MQSNGLTLIVHVFTQPSGQISCFVVSLCTVFRVLFTVYMNKLDQC